MWCCLKKEWEKYLPDKPETPLDKFAAIVCSIVLLGFIMAAITMGINYAKTN